MLYSENFENAFQIEVSQDTRSANSVANRRTHIAVLTHNQQLFALVVDTLACDRTACMAFENETSIIRALKHGSIDLILVDAAFTGSPCRTILQWCECHSNNSIPILALGRFPDQNSLQEAIDDGITDIVRTPHDKQDLLSRVNMALLRTRRTAVRLQTTITLGSYALDLDGNLLTVGSLPIPLTAREFALAWLFFSKPNKTLNRHTIACSVWGSQADIVDRTLEQHIYKLRKKIYLDNTFGIQLRTCYAIGYRLEVLGLCHMARDLRGYGLPSRELDASGMM